MRFNIYLSYQQETKIRTSTYVWRGMKIIVKKKKKDKTRNFSSKPRTVQNDYSFISYNDRIGKLFHNICISTGTMSLRWASYGPWASSFHIFVLILVLIAVVLLWLLGSFWHWDILLGKKGWPRGYRTFFMLNSAPLVASNLRFIS